MSDNATKFTERAWQCHRLAVEINDPRALQEIAKLGCEYAEAARKAGASADALPSFNRVLRIDTEA